MDIWWCISQSLTCKPHDCTCTCMYMLYQPVVHVYFLTSTDKERVRHEGFKMVDGINCLLCFKFS